MRGVVRRGPHVLARMGPRLHPAVDSQQMVAPEKFDTLVVVSVKGIRAMQNAADMLRAEGLLERGKFLDDTAILFARKVHDASGSRATDKSMAELFGVVGKSVRAMKLVVDLLYEIGANGELLENARVALSMALHDATQDTIPISLKDIQDDD